MIRVFAVILILGLGLTPYGCFAPEDKLSVGDLTLVDSFYRQQREELQLVLADSCEAFRQKQLQVWIDSIKIERETEIQKLIESYGQ